MKILLTILLFFVFTFEAIGQEELPRFLVILRYESNWNISYWEDYDYQDKKAGWYYMFEGYDNITNVIKRLNYNNCSQTFTPEKVLGVWEYDWKTDSWLSVEFEFIEEEKVKEEHIEEKRWIEKRWELKQYPHKQRRQ